MATASTSDSSSPTTAPSPSSLGSALVFDAPGTPSQVLSLRQLPGMSSSGGGSSGSASLAPSDIHVQFMLVGGDIGQSVAPPLIMTTPLPCAFPIMHPPNRMGLPALHATLMGLPLVQFASEPFLPSA